MLDLESRFVNVCSCSSPISASKLPSGLKSGPEPGIGSPKQPLGARIGFHLKTLGEREGRTERAKRTERVHGESREDRNCGESKEDKERGW